MNTKKEAPKEPLAGSLADNKNVEVPVSEYRKRFVDCRYAGRRDCPSVEARQSRSLSARPFGP